MNQILAVLNSVPFEVEKLPQTITYINLVTTQLNFIETFVADLLDLRQLKEGFFSLTNAPFNLYNNLQNIFTIFAPQLSRKGVQFNVQVQGQSVNGPVDTTKLPMLIGDERRLKQVIINLVRNAIKFT